MIGGIIGGAVGVAVLLVLLSVLWWKYDDRRAARAARGPTGSVSDTWITRQHRVVPSSD